METGIRVHIKLIFDVIKISNNIPNIINKTQKIIKILIKFIC